MSDQKNTTQDEDMIPPVENAVSAEERIAQLEAEMAALKDQALRALAEAENTRRRVAKEREDISKYAVTAFASDIATVADNLRRAVEAVPPQARETNEAVKNLIQGVEATERQLHNVFEKVGIRRIDPLDQLFDPHLHRVMFEVENTGKPPGTVVSVMQAGYVIHDRLLREALVGVAK